jgi:long-chain acyl-CoA synthetase
MITHYNLTVIFPSAQMEVKIQPGDVYIAYLPLAHVLELAVSNTLLYSGASLGYGSARSLTDTMVKNCPGDLRALKPTLMAGVPAVWVSLLYKSISIPIGKS